MEKEKKKPIVGSFFSRAKQSTRVQAEAQALSMAKPIVRSFFSRFLSLFLLLLHLGCFVFTVRDHHQKQSKKRKISPLSPSSASSSSRIKPHKALSSSWSYLKRIFSYSKLCKTSTDTHPATPALTSARNSQQLLVSTIPSETHLADDKYPPGSCPESDISAENPFFPLQNDIFPCTACGEIFQKPQFLEQHQATKHAISKLIDGDSRKNIVRIIFKTRWTNTEKNPGIHRILKIHNSPKILGRFEEYRELVKAKAARSSGVARRRDERCIADGDELCNGAQSRIERVYSGLNEKMTCHDVTC